MELSSYSFDDNYTYDFSFDEKKKEIVFFYESYFDIVRHIEVYNPCKFIIRNWDYMQVSYDNGIYTNIPRSGIPKCELILEMKEQGHMIYLYAMTEIDEYIHLKFYNASTILEVDDMSKRKNAFDDIRKVSAYYSKMCYVAKIPEIRAEGELLKYIQQILHVPTHISCNWDNLAEVLCSPFWLLGKWEHVIITHENIGYLSAEEKERYRNAINYCRLHSYRISFVFQKNDLKSFAFQ